MAWVVFWPSCVTQEPFEERWLGSLAHKGGLDTAMGSVDTVPSFPIPGAWQAAPARAGHTTGVRNLGPELHKAGGSLYCLALLSAAHGNGH